MQELFEYACVKQFPQGNQILPSDYSQAMLNGTITARCLLFTLLIAHREATTV